MPVPSAAISWGEAAQWIINQIADASLVSEFEDLEVIRPILLEALKRTKVYLPVVYRDKIILLTFTDEQGYSFLIKQLEGGGCLFSCNIGWPTVEEALDKAQGLLDLMVL